MSENPFHITHRVDSNPKRYQQSTNADQKSIETVWRQMAIESSVSNDFFIYVPL